MIEKLLTRRSTPLKNMGDKGPDAQQIELILQAAMRVPDHNKLAPWWFIVFEDDQRAAFGEVLKRAYKCEDPDASPAKLELEGERLMRAPVVVAVISRIREGKAPQWEQRLSAGAACYNLCLAANALGFGTSWLSEWYSFNPVVREALGLDTRDEIAGFIYIGEQTSKPDERDRPVPQDLINRWNGESFVPKKGDHYARVGAGIPKGGFSIVKTDQ